jgi:hypothetical protein
MQVHKKIGIMDRVIIRKELKTVFSRKSISKTKTFSELTMEKILLDSTFITFVVKWTYGLWR